MVSRLEIRVRTRTLLGEEDSKISRAEFELDPNPSGAKHELRQRGYSVNLSHWQGLIPGQECEHCRESWSCPNVKSHLTECVHVQNAAASPARMLATMCKIAVWPHVLSVKGNLCAILLCRELLAFVLNAPGPLWKRAAAGVLGPSHPVLSAPAQGSSSDGAAVRAALHRYSRACEGLRSGSGFAGRRSRDCSSIRCLTQ